MLSFCEKLRTHYGYLISVLLQYLLLFNFIYALGLKLLTNSMVQFHPFEILILYWRRNSLLLRNMKVHYCVHKSLQWNHILSQSTPTPSFTPSSPRSILILSSGLCPGLPYSLFPSFPVFFKVWNTLFLILCIYSVESGGSMFRRRMWTRKTKKEIVITDDLSYQQSVLINNTLWKVL
jgi:hypothetical protein